MNTMLKDLLKNQSSFRHMAICAIAVGVGDVIAVVTDLAWLIGDMAIQTHPHHMPVLVGLVVATVIIVASFVWLIKSIVVYISGHTKKVKAKANVQRRVSKQSEVIMHLNARIDELEARLNKSI